MPSRDRKAGGGLARPLARGLPLAVEILKQQRVVAVPSRDPAGNVACGKGTTSFVVSQGFPPARLHFSVLFLEPPPRQSSTSAVIFQEVWVCAEDPRGAHCLDFAPGASIHCCRAHHAFSVTFHFFGFLSWQFSPHVYPCLGSTTTFARKISFPDFKGVTASVMSMTEMTATTVSVQWYSFCIALN